MAKVEKQKVEARKQALAKLWGVVSKALQPVIRFARTLDVSNVNYDCRLTTINFAGQP